MYEKIMKIPFYTVVGPLLRRNKHYINAICLHPALAFSQFYVGVLGVLGVALSIFDIVRIIKCGPVLPGYLWRERLKEGKLVTPEAERDFKLICLVLSVEYYMFLVIGLITNNPIFYMPFLTLYALIISSEFIMFFTKAFMDGLELNKKACSLNNENMSVPQAAFAAMKVRKNMDKREHQQYCQEERQEVSKYNSKYMNSIWGMYNRFSVHNLKKIMDSSAHQQPKVGLAAASQFSISVERLSYLPL